MAQVSAASPYHTGYQSHQPHQGATYTDPSYSSYSAYSGSYSTQPYQQPTSGGYPEHTSHSGYSSYSVAGHSGHPGHPGHSVYAQRSSPPISSKTDARRLRPLSIPHSSDRYQSTSYYAQSNEPTVVSPSSDVRSPHPSYPSGYAQPSYHAMPSSIYATTPGAGPSRPTHAYGVSTGQQYPAHSPHSAAGVERTVSSRHAPPVPYARTTSVSAADYEPVPEPTIKKKRKRADARQLEVLNSVYGRTAFPSTEERSALGVQLGMSARSVQIWFQNKRQAMRSGGGRGSSSRGSAPPPAPAPVPSPPTPLSAEIPSTAGYPSSRYGRPPSTPATRSTRSPPEAVTTYGSRSPPPGPPSSHSAYSSHMLATRGGQPYAPTRGGQPYVPTRGY